VKRAPYVPDGGMISVIIPTLDAEATLAPTLAALIPAAVEGLVRDVVIADGGSRDRTLQIAENAGVDIVTAPAGRGTQLRAGAARARQPWLLFLHADTELEPGWEHAATHFMHKVDSGRMPQRAAVFRFRLRDEGWKPRLLEHGVAARTALFKLPYGDQGLLIPRSLYEKGGGYAALPLMEDVELVRRLGRSRLSVLRAIATTSAQRYRDDGYLGRSLRNQLCLGLYLAGVSPARLERLYYRRAKRDEPLAAAGLRSKA
jgi:rSAM/selenodomain-associated transferase 2